MFKQYYNHFIQHNPHTIHMASHSHHYWPDCTKKAQQQYWEDSSKYVDDKWNYFFQ